MADAKTAVVIGGTSRIGRAIAERFAEDGYQVVVAGRDAVRGKEAAGACESSSSVWQVGHITSCSSSARVGWRSLASAGAASTSISARRRIVAKRRLIGAGRAGGHDRSGRP